MVGRASELKSKPPQRRSSVAKITSKKTMSLRILVRLSVPRTSSGIRSIRWGALADKKPFIAKLYPLRQREYATSPPPRKKFELPQQYSEEVFHALANNPQVMQGLHNVIEVLNRRGITLDHEPNVSEMWKIMKDKDIMQALNDCIFTLHRIYMLTIVSKICDAAGVKLDQYHI